MNRLHVITPVKDSFETTLVTIGSVMSSVCNVDFSYTIYNDFSSEQTTEALRLESEKQGFTLVNLKDLTDHPSPNYLLVLQLAQQKAVAENAHLLIVESDVILETNTLQKLAENISMHDNVGMVASVTTDINGKINFPYLYAKRYKSGIYETKKRLSFCCTILNINLLKAYNFKELNPEKNWYDVFISHKSVELGFSNYLLTSLPVLHLAHSSRPWKLLKYSNPLKYYWLKITKKRDRI